MHNELLEYLSEYIDITAEEAVALGEMDIVKTYPKGTVLLREGEVSNKGYFIFKGCLRVFYVIDGEEVTTAFYTERHVITPDTVINNKPSAYWLVCVEDCVLNVSTPDMEQEFFAKFPKFESLCRVMAERILADKQLSFDLYKISTPEQRYKHLLQTNAQLINRVPQYQLASYIGVKPESLSRIRKRIAKNA